MGSDLKVVVVSERERASATARKGRWGALRRKGVVILGFGSVYSCVNGKKKKG